MVGGKTAMGDGSGVELLGRGRCFASLREAYEAGNIWVDGGRDRYNSGFANSLDVAKHKCWTYIYHLQYLRKKVGTT